MQLKFLLKSHRDINNRESTLQNFDIRDNQY